MRLIDADKLKECAIACNIHNGTLTDLCVPLYQINNAPTVTPCDNCIELECENHGVVCPHYTANKALEERPQGKWIKQECGYVCSVCGESNDYAYDNNIHKFTDNFCPKCGAKMESEGDY